MKIVFLNFYGGRVSRGVETYVHELANRLTKTNQVIVFQTGQKLPSAKYETEIVSIKADWQELNKLRHLSTKLFFDFSASNLLRRFYLDYWSLRQFKFTEALVKVLPKDIDIVVSAGSGWISFLSRLWCWYSHTKLVVSAQSGPGWDDRINLLCRPNVFVALTKYQADWARRNALGVKVAEIPNGVDLEKFNPAVKSAKVELPGPIFFCVGALEPGKHIDTTVRAVAKLPVGSLVVAGQGKLKEDLEKLAAKLLPGRFSIISVAHNQIPAYYAAANVVTMMPPKTESFGIVFLEGLASNKPVVTTDDPARREIVGGAGLFVDFQDVDGYAQALQKAVSQKWGSIPRHQAEKFSWDKIANQYQKLFNSLQYVTVLK